MNNEIFLLKTVFSEIIRGYSFCHEQSFYIKHPTPYDSFELERIYQNNYNIAKNHGLPTDEEKLKYLSNNNLWNENDEISIKDKNLYLHGLRTNKTKSLISREKEYFSKEIEKTEKELFDLENKKNSLLGLTCEIFASKKCNEFSIIQSLYKDNELKFSFFSENEIQELEDETIQNIYKLYVEISSKFTERNIKKVAASSFFLNLFYLCDNNPQIFYGKAVINLTYYQSNLFNNGCYFKNILSEMKDKITPEILSDPEKLVSMYENTKSLEDIQKSTETKEGLDATSIMGSSKEDRKGQIGLDIATELKKSGKEKFNLKDLVKLHGL